MNDKVIISSTTSEHETIQLGQRLGELLEEGDVVSLVGSLGSGKTWFTKGIALGAGVHPDTVITSPSFALVNEYRGRFIFYHMDLYRLDSRAEIQSAGLEEYLHGPGITVVEWADRCPEILPDQGVKGEFEILEGQRRNIRISGSHRRALEIIDALERGGPRG